MFTGNGGSSRQAKAKMRELPQPHQINLHSPHFASPDSHAQHILNTAAPVNKPFSYMSLLTAPDDEDDLDPLSKDHRQQFDHIIFLHNENLRQTLGGAMEKHHREVHRGAEERATKKQKVRETQLLARNAELERMVAHSRAEAEHYKVQAERLNIRVRYLEHAKTSLTERLQEANAFHHYMEVAQEEAESSFHDPDRVGPILLECKVCERQLATVMLWPCRHVCLCPRCEAGARVCPVCRSVKTHSVEVHLPIN